MNVTSSGSGQTAMSVAGGNDAGLWYDFGPNGVMLKFRRPNIERI
jgi:hypothetical protein